MTREKSHHLLDILAEIPDSRKKKGRHHPLKAILCLVLLAMLAGCHSYTAIAEYGRLYPNLRIPLGFRHAKTPCKATLHLLFAKLDVQVLEAKLTEWVVAKLQDFQSTESSLTAVAIDGKTLRGSKRCQAKITHLMSAVSHELGVTLAQMGMSDADHEIPKSLEILRAFDVGSKVITADALLTQRAFSGAIVSAGGDYVLPIKANHKQVYEDIERVFRQPAETPFQTAFDILKAEHQDWGEILDTFQCSEETHGRIETRHLTTSTALNEYIDWPDIQQVFAHTHARTPELEKSPARRSMASQALNPNAPPPLICYVSSVDIGR